MSPSLMIFESPLYQQEDFSMQNNRLLRRSEVEKLVGLGRSVIHAAIARGEFPSPMKTGRDAVAWHESDIDAWIAARSSKRNVDNQLELGETETGKEVEFRDINLLQPCSRNARTHSKKQISQIAKSIKTFGFLNPIIIDVSGMIIAGHGRLEAAKLLGLQVVPTVLADHLTEAQKRAYALADNKIAENATWDRNLLRIELCQLLEIENEVEIDVTGFATPEIDLLINPVSSALQEPPVPSPPTIPGTVAGDLWHLGRHKVLCGDATKRESFKALLGERKARLVFTDPPYNVSIRGHARGRANTTHSEFAMASGEMTSEEYRCFLAEVMALAAGFSLDGALHYICMDWRHIRDLLEATEGIYSELKNLCVWNKNVGGMGSFYRSKHELVFVFKYGKARHVNNVDLGRFGRNRTNVWDYPGAGSFGKDREATLALHPTVKPLALVTDVVMDASHRRDLVLDPFLGSGTTILAAEHTGRTAFGLEIDPRYVDVILDRWLRFTGVEPVHAASGLTFSKVKKSRNLKPGKGK